MENEREYKYDAFISYRHLELDKFVAVNLHRILETYELPKEVKKKLGINHKAFQRVFRDQEELPLTSNLEDPIIEALENSKYLIVICSPKLKESLWCKKEIETFKKLRGRKNIFCVLVDGEPNESFPPEVLYDEVETVDKNGKVKKEKVMMEPLAADIRGKNNREILKKLKTEKLRLIAPMYNLDFDDLRQRHKIWRQRKIINTTIIIAIATLLFLIYSIYMIVKINLQQNILSEYHAKSLVSQAEDYLAKDDRYNSIKYSYQAITDFYGIVMPYTSEAEYMLTESLGVYDAGVSYKAINSLETDGIIKYLKSSPNNKYAATYDESQVLTLFNTKTLDKIATYSVGSTYDEDKFTFIGDDMFAYINHDGNIILVNINDQELNDEIKKNSYSYKSIKGDALGRYLTYVDSDKFYIFDIKEFKVISEIESKEDIMTELYYSYNSDYLFVGTKEKNYDINKEEYLTIHTMKLEDGKEINKVKIKAGYISNIITKDNNAYMLLNSILGTKYNMVLVSYDYINGKLNYNKAYNNRWGKMMTRSFEDEKNNLAIVTSDTVNVINADNGEFVESFGLGSEVIDIYSFLNKEMYLAFLKNGSVNYLNMDSRNSVEYKGKYEFNLNDYSIVSQSEDGFLLVPTNENRVILYEEKNGFDIKEEDITMDYIKDESISSKEVEKVKEEYNLINRSLVEKVFYDTDKKILFVNYTNGDIFIYNVEDKKLIKTLKKVGKVNHYFGKDNMGRIYIGDISDSYILNSDYDKVGHIKGLCKLDNDRVIITNNKKYYSIKIYSLDELKSIAKEYLGDFEEDLDEDYNLKLK